MKKQVKLPTASDRQRDQPCLYARATEIVFVTCMIGFGILALNLLILDLGRLGLAAIAAVFLIFAALRFHRTDRQRTAILLAVTSTLVLTVLFQWRLAWGGACAAPLLALGAITLLNRRWGRGFVLALTLPIMVTVVAVVWIDAHQGSRPPQFAPVTILAWLVLGATAFALIAREIRHAESTAARVQQVKRTDLLTGLLDRSALKETLGYEAARTNRSQSPFTLALARIDHPEQLRSEYGERCLDWILVTVSNLLKKVLRQQDHLARWGTQEFMILLPDTDGEGGRTAAERIAAEIERSSYLYDGREIDFSLTFAVVTFDGTRSLARCLDDLDQAISADHPPGFIVLSGSLEVP